MEQNPLRGLEAFFTTRSTGRRAAVDLAESDTAFVVRVDLPGYDEDDIGVRLTDHTVRVHAEREGGCEIEKGEAYVRRERSHGGVSRAIDIPGPIDGDAVSAIYEGGVLEITLQKEGEAKVGERATPVS